MDIKELKTLIDKLHKDTISLAELEALHLFLQQHGDEELSNIYNLLPMEGVQTPAKKEGLDRLFEDKRIQKEKQRVGSRRHLITAVGWAAAACISIVFVWQFVLSTPDEKVSLANQIQVAEQIIPGGNKAKIVLEGGRMLDLAALKNDTIIKLNGYSLVKAIDGSVSYINDQTNPEQEIYHTIVTPTGGQYALVLSDGTKVLVNASSTLRYPISFKGRTRKVELNGEAFFEVAKHKLAGKFVPFMVAVGPQEIEVLGTSFNVNSHNNQISTTLVEGSVRLNFKHKAGSTLLKPNQQSIYSTESNSLVVKAIDPFYAVAWKEGAFAFENAPIRAVMEEISRWYNVKVDYKENVDDVSFSGTISKYEEFTKLLQTIELTGSIKFKVQGRRVLVMH